MRLFSVISAVLILFVVIEPPKSLVQIGVNVVNVVTIASRLPLHLLWFNKLVVMMGSKLGVKTEVKLGVKLGEKILYWPSLSAWTDP